MIRTLRRVSGVLSLTRWLAFAATSVVVVVSFAIRLPRVDDAIHIPLRPVQLVVATKARPAACTATLALVVSCERISTRESAAALEAGVRSLAGVQLGVAFQIMQTAEAGLTCRAFVWLLLAVRQQMALQIVMSREVGRAVGALVALG
jgi:hypothetical protein